MRDLHLPGRSPVYATEAMAATSMPAATLTALDVLRAGGNALDAAVAACAVLGVIEPQATGIGGDCFCLWKQPGKPVVAMNGSGRGPAAATVDWFEAHGITAVGETSAHSVTVPGAVGAWEALLAAHGTRGLGELLQPAIRFAAAGWPVHSRVAYDWGLAAGKLRTNGADAFLPRGAAPSPGDVFKQPALAETLRAIARDGSRAFYEGAVAADMVARLREAGGLHTLEDFAAGRTAASFVEPIQSPWRGYHVWQCPPNGSGPMVLMLLGILEGFPVESDPLSVDRLHRHIEAARLVYRDRDAFLADPAHASVPLAHLLSPAYLAGLRACIDPAHALADLPRAGEAALPRHHDTTYLCVVDRDGNACSFINSLFQSFGSGLLASRSGVMLHNRGAGFVVQRGHPNCIAPGKRPLHTIIPGLLIKDGEAVMPYGVMGGHFQPMGQTWFLSNLIEYGLDIQEALDLPRVFPSGGTVELERGIPPAVRDQLAVMGHHPVSAARPHGGGQAIWIDRASGTLVGGSDPRKDGLALGY